ncbi:hypothetical protein P7D22_04755 [Lichenihabitans sp. Uapishka_5]|uniref:hypothetical protein n=1 Tax=Lichenihabitans sp. Uapishka_5 TaxID=3037302 RepID=UPI0029E7E89B|nr:hypothetical protein [Lichenihabitans sp. Uapishka_5]MDX7950489.1 hypothetical protein [Lichenihabitans sp. Uapishka_5]
MRPRDRKFRAIRLDVRAEDAGTRRKAFRRFMDEAVRKALIASRELDGQDLLWFVKPE